MSLFSNDSLMNRFWREGMELQPRWFELFDNFGIKFYYKSEESGQTSLNFDFLQVFNRYSENHRFYHTPKHLLDCLKEFESVKKLAKSPLVIVSALWFHDVVYDPKAKDNEMRSGDYMKRILLSLGVSPNLVNSSNRIVLVTDHKNPIENIDEALAVDVDLSILGKPEEVFNDYNQNIRKEYLWVPEDQYRKGRKQVLRSFLERSQIYQTDQFRQKYEESARVNLERAISSLE
ncbi:MAG: HD domain-containing protein [Candidatus Nanoarchaeia archaeon]